MNNTFESILKEYLTITQFVLKYLKHFLNLIQVLIQKVILVLQEALLAAILSMKIFHMATRLK